MTGASRFLHPFEASSPWFLAPPPKSPDWTFNRSESLSLPSDYLPFHFLVTGHPDLHRDAFDVVEAVEGFSHFRLAGARGLAAVFQESVFVMRRKDQEHAKRGEEETRV